MNFWRGSETLNFQANQQAGCNKNLLSIHIKSTNGQYNGQFMTLSLRSPCHWKINEVDSFPYDLGQLGDRKGERNSFFCGKYMATRQLANIKEKFMSFRMGNLWVIKWVARFFWRFWWKLRAAFERSLQKNKFLHENGDFHPNLPFTIALQMQPNYKLRHRIIH